jgi:hypothetical protein
MSPALGVDVAGIEVSVGKAVGIDVSFGIGEVPVKSTVCLPKAK